MAEWNYEPSWHSIDEINGGFTFKSFTDISASDFNKLVENMQFLYQHYSEGGEIDMNRIYPIGSIFLTLDKTFNPAEMFGGTWTQLKDRFLVGAGGTYNGNVTGGAKSVSLGYNHLPTSVLRAAKNYKTTAVSVQSAGWDSSSIAANAYTSTTVDSADELGDTAYTGKEDVNTMPPYLAVYMWKRTA